MHPELKWIFLLLLGLFVAWIVTGGPARVEENKKNPFLEEPAPIQGGQIYGLDELKDRTRP